MKKCPEEPPSVSVDIIECPSSEISHKSRWRRCCSLMGTPFSLCCGGCTGLEFGYVVVSIYFSFYLLVQRENYAAGFLLLVYVLLLILQTRKKLYSAQFLQCALCISVPCLTTSCYDCAALHWLILLAATVHLGLGLALVELHKYGDCRRCFNEFHKCKCGRDKKPIEAGSLSRLVDVIEQHWTPLHQRESHANMVDNQIELVTHVEKDNV